MSACLRRMRNAVRNQWNVARELTTDAPAEVRHAVLRNIGRIELASPLKGIPWGMIESDAALRDHTEKCALRCAWARELAGMERIAIGEQIEPPSDRLTRVGRVKRLTCVYWWRRRLRMHWHVRAEETLRALGMINRDRSPYVTQWTLRRRRGQKRTLYRALQSAVIETGVGEDREQYSLLDVALKSPANPAIRRNELMARLRGFEGVAADSGHVARFYTLTAPGMFHPYTTTDGTLRPNPAYNNATVRDSREWLGKIWARARARLARLKLPVYGFRIAEPHHCGTPHLHVLLWMRVQDAGLVGAVLQVHALQEYGNEPGARRHRFNIEEIVSEKGSAVGYVAKYIAKNVDGFRVEDDLEAGTTGQQGSRRADAWSSCHRVRQFQQIGGPPVGLWRELRRMRKPCDCERFERARSSADDGDYAGFIRALGGALSGRSTPIRVWTEETGEVGRYGEVAAPKPAGIESLGFRVRTRLRTWRIRWGALSAASPWTRGNNCTPITLPARRCGLNAIPGTDRLTEPDRNRRHADRLRWSSGTSPGEVGRAN